MARETLKQRIALDGGKEIEAELKALGKAGEEAFKQLKDAAARAGRSGNKLGVAVAKLKVSVNGLKTAGDRLNNTFRALGSTASRMRVWLSGIAVRLAAVTAAALGAAAAIKLVATSGAQNAADAKRAAAGLNLTIEEYTRLKFAAEQSGLSVMDFQNALSMLNTKVAGSADKVKKLTNEISLQPDKWAAALEIMLTTPNALKKTTDASDSASKALKKLGVSLLLTGGGRSTNDILLELAEGFKNFPDGVKEAGLAAALFGDQLARKLLPFLNLGKEGIQDLMAEADRLGVTLTKEQGEIGELFTSAQGRLSKAIKGLKDEIGLLFAPALTIAADKQTEALVANRAAIVAFADSTVVQAVQVVRDLFAAFQGRDEDVQFKGILVARDAFVAFADDVKVAWEKIIKPAFDGLLEILDQVAVSINDVFGTEFTGRQIGIAAAAGVLLGVFSSLEAVLLAVTALIVGLVAPEAGAALQETGGALANIFSGLPAQISVAIAKVREFFDALFPPVDEIGEEFNTTGLTEFQVKVLEVRDAFESLGEKAKSVWEKILRPMLDGIASAVNLIAGTDLTGVDILLLAIAGKFLGIFVTIFRIIGALTGIVVIITGITKLVTFLGTVFSVTVAGIVAGLALLGVAVPALLVAAVLAGLIVLGALIVIFWDEIKAGAKLAWEAVSDFAAEAARRIGVLWRALPAILEMVWDDIASGIKSILGGAIDFVIEKFNSLIAAAKRAFAAIKKANAAGAGTGGGSGFSTGGAVVGPGTATSDSIPARLSRGEFVIRAAAVDRYGPRLFAALNSLRMPKGAVPGFSLGGLVEGVTGALSSLAPAPAFAFAGGGAVPAVTVPSGRPVTIVLDGERFKLNAEDSVADSLTRTALGQQRRQAGRQPYWFGG